MHIKSLFFLLFCAFSAQICAVNPLLQKPRQLSPEDIENIASQWNTNITCDLKKSISCSFAYDKGKAGFAVALFSIPFYWKNYRMLPTAQELKYMLSPSNYYYHTPQELQNQCPKNLTKQELMEFIKEKKCIFYTGAGISALSNVACMPELKKSLKLENGTRAFLNAAWKSPNKLCQAFERFCKSAIESQPTPAHFCLKKISEERSTAIITENIDLLQHRTGIEPIFAYSEMLAKLPTEHWQEVDAIVCIGLSHDDRGLLAYYKKQNPKGILIALDLKVPAYISNDDYVCLGNLQEILS